GPDRLQLRLRFLQPARALGVEDGLEPTVRVQVQQPFNHGVLKSVCIDGCLAATPEAVALAADVPAGALLVAAALHAKPGAALGVAAVDEPGPKVLADVGALVARRVQQ